MDKQFDNLTWANLGQLGPTWANLGQLGNHQRWVEDCSWAWRKVIKV